MRAEAERETEGAERETGEREGPGGAGQSEALAMEGDRLATECAGDAATLAAALAGVSPAVRDAALKAAATMYGNQFVNTVVATDKPKAVPRTSPSKKGKDPKYKTTAWASARLFEQLDTDQQALLDGYAAAHPKPKAAPTPGLDEEPSEGKGEVAPLAATAEAASAPEAALEPASEAEAQVEAGPTPTPGALLWGELDLNRRAGFLNITAAMRGNHFSIAGLGLLDDGIQQDRLLFTPASGGSIRPTLENAMKNRKSLGDRGFKKDVPEESMHPGMAEWGARQCVTTCSMQVGGGSAGVFVDIDKFNPKSNILGLFGHIFEVADNSLGHHKTNPFDIARSLDERGDDP